MKKRKKVKKKKRLILTCICLALSFLIITSFIKQDNNKIGNVKKEKNISAFIEDKDYKKEYEEYYYKIDYVEKDNFLSTVNKLLNKKYSPEEINNIFNNLSDKNITKLTNLEHQDLTNYYKIKNLNVDKIDRYNNYKNKNEKYDYQTVVTYVNIDLDIPDYENMNIIENPEDFWVIVNKHNKLPDNYKPKNLVVMNPNNELRTTIKEIAMEPLKEFFNAAKKEGHNLYQTNTYRSYSWQNDLYTAYKKKDGIEKADTYSARPGNSEHQTGLATDVANSDVQGKRLNEDDEIWIKENCYKYGFILRYTDELQHVTRYMAESWHIRYVGKEAAKIIYEKNISLEEYVDLYITEY